MSFRLSIFIIAILQVSGIEIEHRTLQSSLTAPLSSHMCALASAVGEFANPSRCAIHSSQKYSPPSNPNPNQENQIPKKPPSNTATQAPTLMSN